MPPPLALLLFTVFVLALLRLERQQSAGVSGALWIPSIWLMALASKPMGIWFGNTGDLESGSPLDRLFLTALGLAGIVVLARRRFDWADALRRHGWLLALMGYMLVSTLWSDITTVALKRWVRQLIVLIMALVIMSEARPREALESVLRRAAYVLIPFSLMLIKYFPHLGVEYARWSGKQMWIGVTVHKNTLGCLCLISAFFLLWASYRRWRESAQPGGRLHGWADVSVLLIALFLLKGADYAYSATSIGTLVVGLVAFLGLVWLPKMHLPVPRAGLVVLVVALLAVGISAPFLGGSNVAGMTSVFGRDETLTGRTETWLQLVQVVKSQPWVGSGFGSFWTTARREFYEMSHGHNGYLDVLLELGVVGLALYAAWLLSCAGKLHAALAHDYNWAAMAVCFLLMALVYNITESVLNTFAEEMTAVLVLASLVVSPRPSVKSADVRARKSSQAPSFSLKARPTRAFR